MPVRYPPQALDVPTQPGGLRGRSDGYRSAMFLFFSNRLGCLGSLVVSALATVVLILLLAR